MMKPDDERSQRYADLFDTPPGPEMLAFLDMLEAAHTAHVIPPTLRQNMPDSRFARALPRERTTMSMPTTSTSDNSTYETSTRRNAFVPVATALLVVIISALLFQVLHQINGHPPTPAYPTTCAHPISGPHLLDQAQLSNIALVSSQEGWSAGAILAPQHHLQGIILHYQHCQWQRYTTNLDLSKLDLRDIKMLSPDDGWMEGDVHNELSNGADIDGGQAAGVAFFHYIDGQWQRIDIPLAHPLKLAGIHPVSAQESWILGDTQAPGYNGPCCSLLLHETHGTWAKVPLPPSLASLHFDMVTPVGPEDAWLTADAPTGTLLIHYQHGAWTSQLMTGNNTIYDMQMLSPRDGWAAGNAFGAGSDPRRDPYLLHYDGTAWKTVALPPRPNPKQYEGQYLFSVSLDAPSDGWLSGMAIEGSLYSPTSNPPLFYHYTQGHWQRVTVNFPSDVVPNQASSTLQPFPEVMDARVTTLAPNNAWAMITAGTPASAGRGIFVYHSFIFHYDGTQWTLIQQ